MALVSALIDELQNELGESTNDTALTNLFVSWFNDAYMHFGAEVAWFFLRAYPTITTSADDNTYSLTAASARQISAMRVTVTDEPMEYVPYNELVRRGLDLEQTGKPEVWWDTGYDAANDQVTVELWPIPNAVYILEAEVEGAPEVLTDSATIPFPPEFWPLVKDGVRAYYRESEGDYEGAKEIFTRFFGVTAKLAKRFKPKPGRWRRLRVTDVGRSMHQPFVRFPPGQFSN